DDEAPKLIETLPGIKPIKLLRLQSASIAALSQAMLGEAGAGRELVEFLERETEGNVFFVVEVIRALAEEVGQLSEVGQLGAHGRMFTGGMQAVIQRRLGRVPEPARPLLRLAAVAGRTLDLPVLRAVFPDLDAWLAPCADAAVLEIYDQSWRFAHD